MQLDASQIDVTIDTSKPALVTGATGYVAGWIIKDLLEAGVAVHACVRDPSKTDRLAHLEAMAAESGSTITFFAADLLSAGSYTEAMKGCGVVFHTASPFTSKFDDPQKDLIDPAVKGTRNVLESANDTASVTRVVLTSSCAAMYTDAVDTVNAPGGRITEDTWNTTASLDYQPYNYSKTLAEQEAWKIAEAQDRWQLVVINPSLVIGPATNPSPTSESFAIVTQLGDGTMKIGAPRLGLGVVDVRDVSTAHVRAGYLPQAEGRHITSGHNTTIFELGKALHDRFGKDYPLPTRPLPKPLFWLVAPFNGLERTYVSRNVNHAFTADNSKSRSALGLTYRPMQESMEEMFEQMADQGCFTK